MSTICQVPLLNQPIKFLGASVLTTSTTLGIGSASESTLVVDLVEDCDAGDLFWPAAVGNYGSYPLTTGIKVGGPVYFDTTIYGGGFSFGGILTNWTKTLGSSGQTYNAVVTDPRQLLQNVAVVVDSYLGPPSYGYNYINVYAHYEQEVLNGNCSVFGTSGSSQRGMPYTNVINALKQINPVIFSPTGYSFFIDWDTFPTGIPEYYRVTGPQTILQLLEDICETLGFSFYVYLEKNLSNQPLIKIGLINLKSPPGSFDTIFTAFSGLATDITYGQELRNEVTKAVIFGEQQHYLSYVDRFYFYFGQDLYGTEYIPIVPYSIDNENNLFWINKKIDSLNNILDNPFPSNGPYAISEIDIRSAMGSYELWLQSVFTIQKELSNKDDPNSEMVMVYPYLGSFNRALVDLYPNLQNPLKTRLEEVQNANNQRPAADAIHDPNFASVIAAFPETEKELQKIHNWIAELGNTYYGKQFLAELNETICYHQGEEFQEIIFTSDPTNAGGWVDGDEPVLGLADPELGLFRSDDNRVGAFALFTTDGHDEPAPPCEEISRAATKRRCPETKQPPSPGTGGGGSQFESDYTPPSPPP